MVEAEGVEGVGDGGGRGVVGVFMSQCAWTLPGGPLSETRSQWSGKRGAGGCNLELNESFVADSIQNMCHYKAIHVHAVML